MTLDSDNLQSLADLHLCLARAFLPPLSTDFVAALRTDLVDDLDALAEELPFACTEPVGLLRASFTTVDNPEQLLQAYSALFLQPPVRVPLNASVHLDGSLLGPSTKVMEEAYRRHGLQPSDDLRDLSDHLSRLLEFVGLLFARAAEAATAGDDSRAAVLAAEARESSLAFLRPWLPGFAVEIRNACEELELPTPYQHLAELAAIATWEGDTWRHDNDTPRERPEHAPRQTLCSECGKPFAEDAALVAVRRIMEKRGLDISHLDRCPDCRGLSDHGQIEPLHGAEPGLVNAQ
jgi:TorA maturation chaperone TorD